eukprot:TRINITY_DN4531_c0_g1_i1.p1 TRINITY_DN4531_c0_g1~~TRINITY_DN4531_c0_g1_i1.p1  ORF type:complete len:107 (+),score=17.68 TRINITY_DN4531_c0_g1_i1:72-392(+)
MCIRDRSTQSTWDYNILKMPGGFSSEKPMVPEVQAMALSLKTQIEAKIGQYFSVFTPLTYRTQVVAGTNYSIRISVNGGKTITAIVYQTLPCLGGTLTVTSASIAQ